jgi:hypothetical protein
VHYCCRRFMKPDLQKILGAGLGLALGVAAAPEPFPSDLAGWVVEQQAGGTVSVSGGALVIDDAAGCTVWRREPLRAPVRIRFLATVTGGEGRRVSDLNFFWMATDPRAADGFFGLETGRNGKFESYDALRTYYVGCGGNGNSTTRFRRYDGAGGRPLLPEHDLTDPAALLEAGRSYRVEIVVEASGRTTWSRDGVRWFDFLDPEPLREGWFGFRTVWSRIEIRNFLIDTPEG